MAQRMKRVPRRKGITPKRYVTLRSPMEVRPPKGLKSSARGQDNETVKIEEEEDKILFNCTACNATVHVGNVLAHPVLGMGICEGCYNFFFSSPFTKDNPEDLFDHDNECIWCGDGGEVVLCDSCPTSFCKAYIQCNFGEDNLDAIESPSGQWSCFVCDPKQVQSLVAEYKALKKIDKQMKDLLDEMNKHKEENGFGTYSSD